MTLENNYEITKEKDDPKAKNYPEYKINKTRLGINKILKLRSRMKGWSDAEVARRIGISARRYSHYVAGRNEPPIDVLKKLCEILDISPNQILDYKNAQGNSDLDKSLMAGVIVAVEAYIAKKKLNISSKKKARAIIHIYTEASTAGKTAAEINKMVEEILGLIID